jgi:hypothetical protein
MKSRQGYKGFVIEVRSPELRDGGFSAEFSIEEHDGAGVTEIQFYLPDTFPSQQLAIAAATQAGRQKIDVGFERGATIGNGERKEERRPADLKSASQIAVQNAVQTVLRDTLEPPKTTLRPPYSTTTYARLSALRIGCSANLATSACLRF